MFNSGNGFCYKFFMILKNYNDVINYCYILDVLLVILKDLGEVDFIVNNVIRYCLYLIFIICIGFFGKKKIYIVKCYY